MKIVLYKFTPICIDGSWPSAFGTTTEAVNSCITFTCILGFFN